MNVILTVHVFVDSRYTTLIFTLGSSCNNIPVCSLFLFISSNSINMLVGMQVDPGDVVMVSPPLFVQTVPASQ